VEQDAGLEAAAVAEGVTEPMKLTWMGRLLTT
jgi:hypothetical protein